MQTHSDLRARLGEDLWELACSVGQEPMSGQLLTPLPSRGQREFPRHRAAFLVEYPDGLRLKVRRHRDLDTAKRVHRLRSFVDPRHLPAMVAVEGPCHLTEWVPGRPPDREDHRVLRAAGRLLGKMHASQMVEELRKAHFSYGKWEERSRRNAFQLVEAGALTPDLEQSLLDALRETAPLEASPSLIHADLAPENLVLSPEGRLILVDNENLSVDASGFDLARTWYRWPLDKGSSEPFLDGYREHADPSTYLEYSRFWTMTVLLEAARFRIALQTPEARVPLRRLISLLGEAES